MDEICGDLDAEHRALDDIVCDLDEVAWSSPTPADGWDIKETIVHLVQADVAAHLAVTDAENFAVAKSKIATDGFEEVFGIGSNNSGADVLSWWREERRKMLAAFSSLSPKDRIPWFGPDMSALSFATARLMETWSHGRDVADTVGKEWVATDRLRHVAHIGVSTRGWSFLNRGLALPEDPVRVELVAPSGDRWTWGPEDTDSRVSGDAEEFCLLVTQRRHISETDLVAVGDAATEWLEIAQAFAGPPTLPSQNRLLK